jgi:DNA gyrase/topoisomerase IV subunit A
VWSVWFVAFLDHRREVLVRRARHRLARIEARLHILDGLMIAYLNLDEVVRIVRYEDKPKERLVETFSLSGIQADAILNTRLRQLARLEEMEIRREHAELAEERDGILASKQGYGFILPEEEAIAFRRAGKQVLNAGDPSKKGEGAAICLPVAGADQLAVMGDNGKLLVFPIEELPEMPRGKGVKLQTYREGGLRDASAFKADEGLTTVDASGRTRAWPEWREWAGRRAGAGKLAPKGFPASKRFRPR